MTLLRCRNETIWQCTQPPWKEPTGSASIAAKFVVSKVKEMQAKSLSSVVVESDVVLDSPWTELVHSLDPAYYCLQ